MVEYCVFYGKNGERHVVYATDPGKFDKSLPPGREWDYPDEVKILGYPPFKREKTLEELKKEDLAKKYRRSTHLLLAAKDVRLSRAIPKEFK